jgi:hypothetical protein
VTATLLQLGPVAGEQSAQAIVAGLGLSDGGVDGRPRVAAAMIASADGRATAAGTSVGLGHPADRALLGELRTAVDVILVGDVPVEVPLFAAGDGPAVLEGEPLDPARSLRLSDRHRAGDHLFLRYAAAT